MAKEAAEKTEDYLSEEQLEVLAQLEDSKELARKFFELGTAMPSVEQVRFIYEEVFAALEDEEEEDDE